MLIETLIKKLKLSWKYLIILNIDYFKFMQKNNTNSGGTWKKNIGVPN